MALDHPDVITRVAVLDVIPTAEVWDRADARLALAFWPFVMLAQPAPLPERFIESAADAIVADALENWGTPGAMFSPSVRQAYIEALRDPAHAHCICEEYRAAATIDREHDAADLARGRKIERPLLCLWSESGGLARWYEDAGGPLALWRKWAVDVQGEAVSGGHFFPEEEPHLTADLLREFLSPDAAR